VAAVKRDSRDVIVPAGASPGDVVGIVAPSGAVARQALEQGAAVLEGWGYLVSLGEHVDRRHRYLAGTVAERLDDLCSMIRDPAIRAIICARGGYGCVDLLPHIDVALVRANPKLLCGYSDASLLVNFFASSCGVAGLHGPMIASDIAQGLGESAAARLRMLLADPRAAWKQGGLEVIRGGKGYGAMTGGCLSSIVSLIGTPFAQDTTGRVLFLEEIGEKPYRIERMLTQLKLAGFLSAPAAVVFGAFANCGEERDQQVIRAVIEEIFSNAGYPVLAGFPAGHRPEQMTFPIGLPVEVDGGLGEVRSAGSAVRLPGSRSRD